MTLGKLEYEVPRMPDQPPAGLEEPFSETRQGPALDGQRQGQPAEQIAEIVGDDSQEQADLVRGGTETAGCLDLTLGRRVSARDLQKSIRFFAPDYSAALVSVES